MPSILHQIAAGTQPNLALGISKIFQDFQKNQALAAQQEQTNLFKKQQNQIAQDRVDLLGLKSRQAGINQNATDLLNKKKFDSQERVNVQRVKTAQAAEKLSSSRQTNEDLNTNKTRAEIGGVGLRSLLAFPNEFEIAANFGRVKQETEARGGVFPLERYQGKASLEQAILASNIAVDAIGAAKQLRVLKEQDDIRNKNEEEDRGREKIKKNKAGSAFLASLRNPTPGQRQLADSLTSEELLGLNKEKLSIEGIEKKQISEDQFLQRIVDTNEMFISIDTLVDHPGRKAYQGWLGGQLAFKGTEAKNFETLLEKFDSQKFLFNLNRMVNMGALTEAEGQRLINNLSVNDAGVGEVAFVENLIDVRRQLRVALVKNWTIDNPNIRPSAFDKLIKQPWMADEFEKEFKSKLPKGWYFIKKSLFSQGKERVLQEQDRARRRALAQQAQQAQQQVQQRSQFNQLQQQFDPSAAPITAPTQQQAAPQRGVPIDFNQAQQNFQQLSPQEQQARRAQALSFPNETSNFPNSVRRP